MTFSDCRLSIAVLFTFIMCPTAISRKNVSSEQINSHYRESLARLRSFRFWLHYQSDAPVAIRARFAGKWQSPDREEWNGFWEGEGKREKVCLCASDDRQFELTPLGWQVAKRGLETKLLDQIQQVFHGATLELIGEERGKYLYRFRPNLPLIDPGGVKGLKGIVEVDHYSGLPVRIYCVDEQKRNEWELRLDRFNRAGSVKIPFVPVLRATLSSVGYRWTCGERKRAMVIMEERLKELGVDFRMSWGRAGIDLAIDRMIARPGLELLFSVGRVEVWRGEEIQQTLSDSEGKNAIPIAGDEARKVILRTLLGQNGSLYAEPEFDLPVEPKLRVSFNSGLIEEGGLVVLVVDGIAISIGKADGEKGFVFTDIGGKEKVGIIAALANHPALPREFRVMLKGES